MGGIGESVHAFRVGKRGFLRGLIGLSAAATVIPFVSPHLQAIFRIQA